MKYYRLVLIGLFTFFCFSLNAQFFVGGNFSLSTSGGSIDNDNSTTTDKTSSFSFNECEKWGDFYLRNLQWECCTGYYIFPE